MSGPLVTFAVFAYNHEDFIEEAIAGALAQEYRPIEIIVADDASTDGTAAAIDRALRIAGANDRVRVLRNPANRGMIGTVNRVTSEARGDIIFIAAGDDVSLPHRATDTVRAFTDHPDACSVYGNGMVMDASGRDLRPFYPHPPAESRHTAEHAAREGLAVLGASQAFHRRLFDELGPLPERGVYEDHAIAFRAALLGTIRYVDRILVRYRQHGGNVFLGATTDASVEQWHRSLQKSTRYEREMLLARLDDLETARKRLPDRAAELERLRRMTAGAVAERDAYLRLLEGASLAKRIITIANRAFHGMPPRRVVRWILTFLFPAFYLRRIQRQSALTGAAPAA